MKTEPQFVREIDLINLPCTKVQCVEDPKSKNDIAKKHLIREFQTID